MYKILALLILFFVTPVYANSYDERMQEDQKCLSQAIYYEARGESQIGQLAVAYVMLNRSIRFKTTICKQVKDLHRFWPKKPKPQPIIKLSRNYYNFIDPTNGSIYFKSKRLGKSWGPDKQYVVTIDNHNFYRERNNEKNYRSTIRTKRIGKSNGKR